MLYRATLNKQFIANLYSDEWRVRCDELGVKFNRSDIKLAFVVD